MENRLKYFAKNTTIFAIGQMGTKLINFLLVPLYTRILTTEEYGTVDLIFTIASVIVPFIMFSIGEAIMRYTMDKDTEINDILSISYCVVIFGILISVIIIFVSDRIVLLQGYGVYIYFYVIFSAASEVFTGFLRGSEKLGMFVGCNLLRTVLVGSLNIIFLVCLHMGIEGYLWAYVIAEFVTMLAAFFCGKIYRGIFHFSIKPKLAKEMIKFSFAVIPNSMLWWIINSSDRIMVTAIVSVTANGILAVSYKLPSIMNMINTILMQAWKYSAIHEKDSHDVNEFSNHILSRFLQAIVLISAFMIINIKWITVFLYEEEYAKAWLPSVFLLVGFVFMGLGTFIGTIYYVQKNMIGNMLSAMAGAVVNIILNAILIPVMDAAGATLAACICYLVIMIYRYIDTKKYQKLNLFSRDNNLKILLLLIVLLGSILNSKLGILIETIGFVLLILSCRKFILYCYNIGLHLTRIKK